MKKVITVNVKGFDLLVEAEIRKNGQKITCPICSKSHSVSSIDQDACQVKSVNDFSLHNSDLPKHAIIAANKSFCVQATNLILENKGCLFCNEKNS